MRSPRVVDIGIGATNVGGIRPSHWARAILAVSTATPALSASPPAPSMALVLSLLQPPFECSSAPFPASAPCPRPLTPLMLPVHHLASPPGLATVPITELVPAAPPPWPPDPVVPPLPSALRYSPPPLCHASRHASWPHTPCTPVCTLTPVTPATAALTPTTLALRPCVAHIRFSGLEPPLSSLALPSGGARPGPHTTTLLAPSTPSPRPSTAPVLPASTSFAWTYITHVTCVTGHGPRAIHYGHGLRIRRPHRCAIHHITCLACALRTATIPWGCSHGLPMALLLAPTPPAMAYVQPAMTRAPLVWC